ncbi:RNA polymerase subunit sigma [Streptomyces bungoensis]
MVPLAELLDERRHLLDVAGWRLGSGREAEAVTDAAYRQWYGLSDAERALISVPRAWLARLVGTICLERLASPDRENDPSELSDVFPPSRAAGPVTTARALPLPQQAVLDHARRSLRARRARPASAQRQDEIVHSVCQACADGDTDRLRSLMAPDATACFDGGGKVRTATRPVHGGAQVTRSLVTLLAGQRHTTLHTHAVNGRIGLVARHRAQVAAVVTLDVAGTEVAHVWVTLNPDKLRTWNRSRACA